MVHPKIKRQASTSSETCCTLYKKLLTAEQNYASTLVLLDQARERAGGTACVEYDALLWTERHYLYTLRHLCSDFISTQDLCDECKNLGSVYNK